MADNTKIEWADATWSPLIGCSKVSPGCDHCYAITTAHRMSRNPNEKIATAYAGTEEGGEWTGQVNLLPNRLDQPLRWKRSRRIFVNSQSDLFHNEVPDEFIARVFAVMALASQHQFQVLTKRPGRMRSLLWSEEFEARVFDACEGEFEGYFGLPLPNVWLGTSVEDQKWADVRVPLLLDTPAAVRFLSCEPLLGPVDLARALDRWEPKGAEWDAAPAGEFFARQMLHWIIVGGESGQGARPMHPEWARTLRDQAQKAGIAFLFKQWGAWARAEDSGVRNVAVSRKRWQYESIRFQPDGTVYRADEPDGYSEPGMTSMLRVGKHKAGRMLDGRTWDEYPEGGA